MVRFDSAGRTAWQQPTEKGLWHALCVAEGVMLPPKSARTVADQAARAPRGPDHHQVVGTLAHSGGTLAWEGVLPRARPGPPRITTCLRMVPASHTSRDETRRDETGNARTRPPRQVRHPTLTHCRVPLATSPHRMHAPPPLGTCTRSLPSPSPAAQELRANLPLMLWQQIYDADCEAKKVTIWLGGNLGTSKGRGVCRATGLELQLSLHV